MRAEYLGDIEITDAFFQRLRNVNQHVNGISKIPRGHYSVRVDLDAGMLILELKKSEENDIDRAEKLNAGHPASPQAAAVQKMAKKAGQ